SSTSTPTARSAGSPRPSRARGRSRPRRSPPRTSSGSGSAASRPRTSPTLEGPSSECASRSEREITEAVPLCTADGRLDPAAVGWSRRPLHACNLRGSWPRKKRWVYWGIASDELVFAITLADLDYFGLAVVSLLDLETGRLFEKSLVLPL